MSQTETILRSPELTAPKERARARLLALVTALLGLLTFRLTALYFNASGLDQDEAQYWLWSRELAFGYYSKPPLVAWLIGVSTLGCGVSEFCIRVSSPLIHSLTAMVVFAIGNRLHGPKVGFWSALVFATLPGISYSAGVISTDVPLLFFWAVSLYAFISFVDSDDWWSAILLGLALGLGLNSKYAMAYFVLCAVLYLAITPQRRQLLVGARWWSAIGVALVLLVPNLIWNYGNGFATLAHIGENARWSGNLFRPAEGLAFLGTQFGYFGPVLFFGFLVVTWRAWRTGLRPADRLLLAFSLPIVALIAIQAFISGAHPNWAATAYVAAAVLVSAAMIRDGLWGWIKASLALHLVILVALAAAYRQVHIINLTVLEQPVRAVLGWNAVAEATRAELDHARRNGQPYGSVLTKSRRFTTELLYYLRDEQTPILAWRRSERPRDHFSLTRPFREGSPEPVLYADNDPPPPFIAEKFNEVEIVAIHDLVVGAYAARRMTYTRLNGYRSN